MLVTTLRNRNRPKQIKLKLWGAAVFLIGFAVALPAQEPEVKNPHTTPADVAIGAGIFRSHCAECHGIGGTGGRGPNLTIGRFRHGASDAALLRTIKDGIRGTQMPGCYFSEPKLWRVVAYVRSLSERPRVTNLPGNPAQGEELFHGRGACLPCHLVNGEGGRLGPDLTDIGSQRNPEYLKTSLVKPDEHVDLRYWSLRIAAKGGKTLQGIRLNEDPYSLQMMDREENLHSLWKRDLEIRLEKKSWMPSYEGILSAEEVDDLVAYLASLRRKPRPQ